MAIKRVRPNKEHYGYIDRGASLTIPVTIMDPEEKPIDLTGAHIAFTIKRGPFDFDMEDTRAYVAKDFEPQDPANGKFFVQLSSKDTDFEPGEFHFDILVYKDDGAVFRIVNLDFVLVGGPTNRTINDGVGQLPVGDEITLIVLPTGRPIIVIAPIAGDAAVGTQLTNIWSALADLGNQFQTLSDKIDNLETTYDFATMQSTIADLEARVFALENP